MKISTTHPNLANRIAEHVTRRFPDLARNPMPDVWFTGSNVWRLLYDESVPDGLDWDIFTLDELTAMQLVTGMSWNLCPAFPTREKRSGDRNPVMDPERNIPKLSKKLDADGNAYSDGYCYLTDAGEVDVWVTGARDALTEIRTYPLASHAHCRAAFSFTDGLIVLPNEMAGYTALRENTEF